MLNTQIHGEDRTGPVLVIAHGLFGSGRNWRAIARQLARARPVVTVDMRNHGESFHSPRHDYPAMAEDLAEVVEASGAPADVLGHSMGGKAAMMLALERPELVRRLVVADIAPVGYDHTQAPLIEAMRAVPLDKVQSRRDAEAVLKPLIPEDAVRAFLLQSLEILPGGGGRWRLNLDALAANMDSIIGFPDVEGRRFDGPALFVRGGASDYVRPEHEPRIRALFPAAEIRTIEGAGHWVHADRPREFIALVDRFLSDGAEAT